MKYQIIICDDQWSSTINIHQTFSDMDLACEQSVEADFKMNSMKTVRKSI